MSVSAAFGWAIACVLRWDTCCDCSCFLFCFVCQRYLKLTGLLLGERFLRWRGTRPFPERPPSPHALQLNIVSAAAGFRIKTKCVVEPNHAHHPFGRGGDLVHSGNTAANEKLLPISGELSGTCSLLGGPLRESAHCIDT